MNVHSTNNYPFVSIIIPAYNDPDGLHDTLESLIVQDYPHDYFEIIIADNGSTDETLDVAQKYKQKHNGMIKIVIENTIQSSYAARNKGICLSKGSVLAFVDADMSMDADWLKRISKYLEKYDADYLACNVKVYTTDDSTAALYDKLTGFPIEKYINSNHFAPTCCLVIKRQIIDIVGNFNSLLISSGDYEFGNRVYRKGYPLHYRPDIVMYHPARNTLKKMVKKGIRIGRGKKQLSLHHPEIIQYKFRPINPIWYSPAPPWIFIKSINRKDIWKPLSIIKKVEIYMINWLLRLSEQYGYICESVKR